MHYMVNGHRFLFPLSLNNKGISHIVFLPGQLTQTLRHAGGAAWRSVRASVGRGGSGPRWDEEFCGGGCCKADVLWVM